MNDLLKFLVEREKLERLIMILLKITITVTVLFSILNIYASIQEIATGDFLRDHKIVCVLFFSFGFAILWNLIWSYGVVFIQPIINLLSTKFGKNTFLEIFLLLAGVLDIRLTPTNKAIAFSNELNSLAEKDENPFNEGESKMVQYFLIGLFGYLTLLNAEEISIAWPHHLIIIFALLSMLFTAIMIQSLSEQFDNSLLELRKKYKKVAYFLMVKNAINLLNLSEFNVDVRSRRIFLKKKEDWMPYPPIIITPSFFWNYDLGCRKLVEEFTKAQMRLLEKGKKEFTETTIRYSVLVSNIKPEIVEKYISKFERAIYIYGETENDINNRIEEMFHVISNENFERLTIATADENGDIESTNDEKEDNRESN